MSNAAVSDLPLFTAPAVSRAAGLAVRRAVNRLASRGNVGEANRARVMSDTWRRFAAELISDNAARLEGARPCAVIWTLSRFVQRAILQTEITGQRKEMAQRRKATFRAS
jgi:hypothetical protein